jgi:hypothetical protein
MTVQHPHPTPRIDRRPLSCRSVTDLDLIAYIGDRSLTAHGRAVQEHIDSCSYCRYRQGVFNRALVLRSTRAPHHS